MMVRDDYQGEGLVGYMLPKNQVMREILEKRQFHFSDLLNEPLIKATLKW